MFSGYLKQNSFKSAALLGLSALLLISTTSCGTKENATRIISAPDSVTAPPSPPATTDTVQANSSVKPLPGIPYQADLVTDNDEPFRPINIIATEENIFFLSGDAIFIAPAPLPEAATGGKIQARKIKPSLEGDHALSIKPHEFAGFVYCAPRQSVIVLDKSGDIFEYSLATEKWTVLRANVQISSPPDPEFIDLCLIEDGRVLNLLDPERNQIWRLNLPPQAGEKVDPTMTRTFPEVLPWRLQPKDASVAECIAIAYDERYYLLKQSGQIITILPSAKVESPVLQQNILPFKPMPPRVGHSVRYGGVRASRMISAEGAPLYVVERQNNRVLVVDKKSGYTRQFVFADTSNLRGLCPDKNGMWIIDNDKLRYCQLDKSEAVSNKINGRKLDNRLRVLRMPIKNMRLPGHAGVFPGARRLYRHGVHEGLDFFNDRGHVAMNTPVVAAGPGKIVRADSNYKDMTRAIFNRVMKDCVVEHRTSESNEDLFRGCQVWIDHGDNLVTRYGHLNKINPKIKVGQTVKPGDLIGFVGVSGTGQNLPGQTKYPHLHFEIWLDGNYLGYGLTPSETVGIFEDIFESAH